MLKMSNQPTQKLKNLKGRQPLVVLGITGGVAAYKAVELCRSLVKADFDVATALSPSASLMVGEKTFAALSSRKPL